jgi:OOP family OmpA-OmpF porin
MLGSASGDLNVRLMRALLAISCAVAALSHTTCARGQDVQRFYPALSEAGFLGLDTTRTPGPLRGSVSLFSDLAVNPVELKTATGSITPVETRLMLHLAAEIGLWGRAALAVRLPLIAYQNAAFKTDSQVFTLTDPQLWARYRLLGPSMSDRDAPRDGPGLSVQGGIAVPLGKTSRVTPSATTPTPSVARYAFASDGSAHTDLALVSDFQLLGAGIGGTLGWRHHFWNPDGIRASATHANDELTFGAALKLPVPALPILSGVLELRGVTGFKAARDTSLELDLGARLTLGNFVIVLGGGVGLTSGVGTPDGRVFLGLYGVPPRADQDDDGVDDDDDQCPFLAEDRDGFQDADGCPDPDNDEDMIPDVDDKCPNATAEEGHDDDEDGCTDPAK